MTTRVIKGTTTCLCGCGGPLPLRGDGVQGRFKQRLPGHGKSGIRHLRAGEAIPHRDPRRYLRASGYVVLRWTLADGSEVEAYEHRVVDGVVISGERHHKNGDKADNQPDNLETLTRSEHSRLHAREREAYDIDLAASLYRAGFSIKALASYFKVNGASLMRRLKTWGVTVRSMRDGIKQRRPLSVQLEEIHGHVLKPVTQTDDATVIRYERVK